MSLVLKILTMAVLIVAARISHYQVFCELSARSNT